MTVSSFQRKLAFAALVLFVVTLGLPSTFAQSEQSSSAVLNAVSKIPGLSNIKHVVFIVRENRSFDSMFGRNFPGANGATQGLASTGQVIQLQHYPDAMQHDICHGWGCFVTAIDHGKMDGFDQINVSPACNINGDYECYGQQWQSDIPNYWQLATDFALADNYFTSNLASTSPNHLYTIAAQSGGMITNAPDGCDSPTNIDVAILDANGNLTTQFPCLDMPTMMDELQAANVTWRYYADTKIPFNSMELISHLRYGPLWPNNVSDGQFVPDVQNGNLPQVSWLMATGEATDHPPYSICFGENYTVNAVNAILNSKYWTTEPTAIFIVWDDPAGIYDHVAPPRIDQYGLDMRAPMIVISPYTPDSGAGNSVTHVQYEHSAVLTFMEDLFNLQPLTNRDKNANHMALDPVLFNFNQGLRSYPPLNLRQCVPNSTNNLTFYLPQPVGTPSTVNTVTMRNFSKTSTLTFSSVKITGNPDFTETNTCANGVSPLLNESPFNCTINVTYTPSTTGPETATLTITDSDASSPQTVILNGVGTNVTLNPTLLNFGSQRVFMSGTAQMATLTNGGSTPISISSIQASGDYTQTNNCGSSLGPLSSCTITATFMPTVTGTRYGTVTVTDSDGASPHVLQLTGMGTLVSLTPNVLSFGNRAIGSSSAPQPVTLMNVGNTTLTLANPNPGFPAIWMTADNGTQAESNTPDFQQNNNCGSSLAPGAMCTINISFTPVVQGALIGQLFVWDNEGDSPQVVNITGTGTASTNNPIPFTAQSLSPRAAAPGSGNQTMTVNGAGFGTKTVVNWNGSPLATTFVSGHQLTATIPSSDLATATTGTITTSTGTPGGGISNSQYFQVANSTTAVTLNRNDITVGHGPKDVVAADFNKDGKLDLVVLNSTDSTASIYMGNGDGTFTFVGSMCTGGSTNSVCNAVSPVAAAVGDFNEDGDLDLIVANNVGNNMSILLGNGQLSFTQGAFISAIWPTDVQVADFNRDGHLDVTYPYSLASAIAVWLGNGDGTFLQATTPPAPGVGPVAIALGDFNLDNKVDIAIVDNTDSNVTILVGNGDGTFKYGPGSKPNTGNNPVAIAAGDLNGDGKVDLVTANQTDGTVTVLLSNGNGSFTPRGPFSTGASPDGIALGDFNADNKLDVAVSNSGAGTVSLLLGNGNGTLQAHSDTSVGSAPAGLTTGDFNRDGNLDLAVANVSSNSTSVMLGQGSSNGGAMVTVAPSSLSFGTVPIGVVSAKQPVTVTNTGTIAVTISNETISSNFLKTNQCPGTLPVGGSCKILVAFNPQSMGKLTGTLSITDNAGGSPQTVSLSGTGTAVSLTPSSLNFGTVNVGTTTASQTITVKNVAPSGNLKLTNISLTGTNASDYRITSNNCPTSLAAGATCMVSVDFTPSATGTRTASVQFTDNGGGSPQLEPLTGVGQ